MRRFVFKTSWCRRLVWLWLATLSLKVVVATEVYPPTIVNDLGMIFVIIPAGEFLMGTHDLDQALFESPGPDSSQIRDETPAHTVTFKKSFYLGRTEVTQEQWYKIMNTKPGPDSHWQRSDWRELPLVSISWYRVQEYVKQLNERDNKFRYRLPTEAEWEYAARAGTDDLRPFPIEHLKDHAWYIENSDDIPQPVATRRPNAWGLYDMLGNAWEWVDDWYGPDTYTQGKTVNPKGPPTGRLRVRRGGSYHCQPHLVRSAYRAADKPEQAYSVLGFRLVAERRSLSENRSRSQEKRD